MGMTAFDIAAVLTLNSAPFDAGLKKAKGQALGFGTTAKKSFGGVVKAFGAMGIAAAAFAGLSLKTGAEFDKSMSQVAATLGITMEEMNSTVGEVDTQFGHFSGTLRDFAMFMGKNTAFSARQASEALNYMALAGYDAQTSMKMLPNVLNLAAAGNMELATASDMVTDAQSALGLSLEETTKMVDEMARASSRSNTSVEQLGSAFLTVGGTAKILKGGTTELATALGLLADNGIKGAEGGTALRNILNSISGKKFEKNFGALGISAYDAQGNMRDLKDVFIDMNKAMDGMSTKDRTKLIASTFNIRDLKSVNALLGTSVTRWDELTAAIEDSEGAAGKMAETQLDNLAGDITLMKSAFEGLQITISDKLSPSFRIFVQGVTNGIGVINDIMSGEGVNGVRSFASAVVSAIANAIPDAIRSIPSAIGDFNRMLRDVAESLDPKYIGGTFAASIINAFKDIGPTVATQLEFTLTHIVDIFYNAREKFAGFAINMVTGLVEAFSSMREKFAEIAINMMMAIGSGLEDGLPVLMEYMLPLIDGLVANSRELAGKLVDAGLYLITNLAKGIANSLPILIQYVPSIITNIAGIINDNAPKLITTAIQIIAILGKGLIEALPVLIANIPAILQAIVAAFMAFGWVGLGKSIVAGIGKGIKAAGSFITASMKRVGNAAVKGFYYSFRSSIKSGATIMKSLGNALKSGGQAAMKALTRIWSKAKDSLVKPFTTARDKIRGILDKIRGLFPIKVGHLFSGIKLPSFNWSWKKVVGGLKVPHFTGITWNAKAEDNPYLFRKATIFGAGERKDEIMYGRKRLMDDITKATSQNASGANITNYITVDGSENPEEFANRFVRQLEMQMRTA